MNTIFVLCGVLTTVIAAHAEIRMTDTKNIAIRRHLLFATISPGGEQAPGSSTGVSEGGTGLQQPSNQQRYTKIINTINVGDRVPYSTMLLKTKGNL